MLQDRSSARPTEQVRVNLRKLQYQAPFSNHNSVRLEISYKKKKLRKKKNTHLWRLNNMLLNNQWITEEIKQYLETNEKAVPRRKFKAMQTYLRKQEKSQMTSHYT